MMRRSSIVSLSALLLLLTAGCQGMREKPLQDADTPSYIGVSVRVAGGLRAVTDKQQEEPGIDRERSVSGASLLLRDYVAIPFTFPNASVIADSYESEVKSVYPKGELEMALIVNSSALGNLSRPDFRDDRTLALSDLPKTYGASGMLMTSTVADDSKNKGTIYPGKTEAEVRAKSFNHFSFDVERVVAKLQVTMKKGTKLELPMGTLSPLTYSMAGSAKETYLFRDHAGSRTLVDKDGQNAIYENFMSVIDEKSVPTDWESKERHPFLQRVSDKEDDNYVLGGYYSTPKNVTTATEKPTSIDGGFYFYENSMYGGTTVASKKGEIKYNRIAYAKVYTKLDEITGWKLTKNEMDIERERGTWGKETTNRRTAVPVPFNWYLQAGTKHPKWVNERLYRGTDPIKDGGAFLFEVIDTPKTFYYCEDDGEIFDTARAAYIYYKGFPKNLRKYDGGRMVYMLPLNAQLDTTKGFVNYCDTRRNNIYNLRIEKVSGLGRNYDPVDPDDPNVPKPEENPFEPPTDPQIPVEPADYMMRITGTILNWNQVVKNYVLWN